MKTFFFHLMPYADLDLSYTERHNSAWVTLPNSYFDPAVGQKLYARYIGELELADQLGFDGICVNEHHQTAYGLMPAPNLIAAALARSTKQAKIAILGRAQRLLTSFDARPADRLVAAEQPPRVTEFEAAIYQRRRRYWSGCRRRSW